MGAVAYGMLSSWHMAKIKVKCTFYVEVDVPDAPDYNASFDIESNHCPVTGIVGAAVDAVTTAASAAGTCWMCALGGTCEIVHP